jgi:hypothetical protein
MLREVPKITIISVGRFGFGYSKICFICLERFIWATTSFVFG